MAIISVSPALVALLPTGSEVHWTGTDSTAPDGYFGVIGINCFGVDTFWLVAGTPETPTAIAGRSLRVWCIGSRPADYQRTAATALDTLAAAGLVDRAVVEAYAAAGRLVRETEAREAVRERDLRLRAARDKKADAALPDTTLF